MLKIRNLQAGYGKLKVLKNISMHVAKGEIVTILGANGAGKTTLLSAISGLLKATSGEILFKERNIGALAPQKLPALGCVMVPEGRQIFSTLSVEENLILGGRALPNKTKKALALQLDRQYELFPILSARKDQYAGTLSGGEQQMLAMGRALMSKPSLIMMDEPSTGLAPLIVQDIFKIIVKMRDEGKTVLLVEQNAKAALHVADRGYVLETGKVVLQGKSQELLEDVEVKRAYLGKDYGEFYDGKI